MVLTSACPCASVNDSQRKDSDQMKHENDLSHTIEPDFNMEMLLRVNPIIKGILPTNCNGTIFFGRMWVDWELPYLHKEINEKDISFIFNLIEKPHGDVLFAKEVWAAIPDYSVPTDVQAFSDNLEFLISQLKTKNILVHCLGGRGRTTIALSCLLIRLGETPEDTLAQVSALTRGVEKAEQRDFILGFK